MNNNLESKMFIKQVALKNFMRYEDQVVDLDAGFNTFVGSSDSGKSTILRGLIWVFYNRPTGIEMCRVGTEETSVKLILDNGNEITRVRSKKRNAYILNTGSGDQPYDAVKTEVPEEVAQALGLVLAEIGPKMFEMLNVSRQLDGPFMLSGSGGDSAKILGNLSGITTLDLALGSIRPDLSSIKKELDSIDKLQKTYDITIKEFSDLDNEVKGIEKLGRLVSLAQDTSSKLEAFKLILIRMNDYLDSVAHIDSRIEEVKANLEANKPYSTAVKISNSLQNLRDIEIRMVNYGINYQAHFNSVSEIESLIKESELNYNKALKEAGTCPTCNQSTRNI